MKVTIMSSITSVFIVYRIDDFVNVAAFSSKFHAKEWIFKNQTSSKHEYDIEELPVDTCIDGYELYVITHRVGSESDEESWNIFKDPTSFEQEKPHNYGDGKWWSVRLRRRFESDALEDAKILINKAKMVIND